MKNKALSFIAVITIFIGITTALAAAQTRRQPTVIAFVPFEFVVGNQTFPSGTYVFEMATGAPKATDEAGVLIGLEPLAEPVHRVLDADPAQDGDTVPLGLPVDGERVAPGPEFGA